MIFSKDYSKLDQNIFTTIRKNSIIYRIGNIYKIKTPTKEFKAMVIGRWLMEKAHISEQLAYNDADCSRDELIAMLEKWYGKEFDDFVLLTLEKEKS